MKKGCLFTVIGFFIFATILGIVLGDGSKATESKSPQKEALIDANQFSNITPEQLVKIMGEPESKDKSNFKSINGKTYPLITYTYKGGSYDFLVIDGKVVELNVYSGDAVKMPYTDEQVIFPMFGITPADTMVKTVDTGVALEYESVTDKIDDVYVLLDTDEEKEKIDIAKIKYDKSYFGNPPRMAMSIDEESNIQIACQNGVKSILKSPSTAKFPNINDWYIGKDKDKILVQSYVDSQNGFGAMIRSKFQFILTPDGDGVKSFIFDGQEYMK